MKTLTWTLVPIWLGLWIVPHPARGDEPIRLQELYPAGAQYHVSTRTDLSGRMTLPPEKAGTAPKTLTVTGTSAIEYDERVLSLDKNGIAQKTVRIYRRIDFQRKVGERLQESSIRPAVRRLVILRHQPVEVPVSPDGPLTWGEIDLVRTDVFAPALTGLLPEQPVRRGDRWQARAIAVQELTDMERIEEGGLECRLEDIITWPCGNTPGWPLPAPCAGSTRTAPIANNSMAISTSTSNPAI